MRAFMIYSHVAFAFPFFSESKETVSTGSLFLTLLPQFGQKFLLSVMMSWSPETPPVLSPGLFLA
jgi:hypothetical protein